MQHTGRIASLMSEADKEIQYAIETMDCGIMTLTRNGEISYYNPLAAKFFNLSKSNNLSFREAAGINGTMNEEFIDLVIEALIHKEKKKTGSVEVATADNEKKWLYVSCTRMANGSTVVTFIDRTELHYQEKKTQDSVYILTKVLFMGCLWAVLVSFWNYLGRPWNVGIFTVGIELLGFLIMAAIVRRTNLTKADLGLSTDNIRQTAISTLIRSVVLLLSCCAVKLIIMQVRPSFFPVDAPFWDWHQADFRLVKYLFTAFFQELLSRGGIQECLMRIIPGKRSDFSAIILSSLFFMAVHVQNGFYFSLGAGILSVILGLMYRKDRNVYGVTVIHYLFGKIADFLLFTA